MLKIESQDLADLFWYWKSLSHQGAPPLRREIDPGKIPPTILPYVYTMIVERDPLRFCSSLSGTGVRQLVSRERKGDYVSEENMGPNFQDAFDSYAKTVETGRACWGKARFVKALPGDIDLPVEGMFLPLSEAGHTVDYVFGVSALQIPPEYRMMIEPGIFMTRRWHMDIPPTIIDEAALLPPRQSYVPVITPAPVSDSVQQHQDTAPY